MEHPHNQKEDSTIFYFSYHRLDDKIEYSNPSDVNRFIIFPCGCIAIEDNTELTIVGSIAKEVK